MAGSSDREKAILYQCYFGWLEHVCVILIQLQTVNVVANAWRTEAGMLAIQFRGSNQGRIDISDVLCQPSLYHSFVQCCVGVETDNLRLPMPLVCKLPLSSNHATATWEQLEVG